MLVIKDYLINGSGKKPQTSTDLLQLVTVLQQTGHDNDPFLLKNISVEHRSICAVNDNGGICHCMKYIQYMINRFTNSDLQK